jgi:cation diffusion facilitator CzcD-associated flavoprotein CzcO
MSASAQVAIIGAGPYGLSVAAHLRARGINFRIFGQPMESWSSRMPRGMLLKSEGFASDIYEPERRYTLKQFCAQHELPYADVGLPVSLETMTAYGLCFQKHFVPELETRFVIRVERIPDKFVVELEDGELLSARRVIIATGSSYFKYIPEALAALPTEVLSHSCEHQSLDHLKGRDVVIVGGGASALDLAALLHDLGANVRLVVRKQTLTFLSKPEPRSTWRSLRYPVSGIGGGWRSLIFADAPMLFRYLPANVRLQTVQTYLGPAGAWFTRDRLIGNVPVLLSHSLVSGDVQRSRVRLTLNDGNGHRELTADHVIAATGYRVDIQRLNFLSATILARLKLVDNAPVLSQDFESSVPGLYFVGLASACYFGPVMRFLFGARYTAPRIARHLSCFRPG